MFERYRMTAERGRAWPAWPSLVVAVLLAGSLFLALQTAFSLRWGVVHDGAFLHYIALLIDRYGYVPYRDILENSLPLTYWFHLGIGRTLGYGDLAFRVVDVVYLGALLFVTWRLLRPFGTLVSWAAVLSFGLLYQSFGQTMTLQRDYLCLLPLAGAIWLAGRRGGRRTRLVLIGALFGVVASLKPHYIIGLPPVLVYALAGANGPGWRARPARRAVVEAFLLAALGVVLAAAPPFLWVWARGGLPWLWANVTEYLPLYNRLSGNQELLGPGERWIYLYQTAQAFGGHAALLIPAAVGSYFALVDLRLPAAQRRLATLLVVLLPLYVLTTFLAGKFWSYHWMPAFYFAVCLGALVLLPLQAPDGAPGRRVFAVAVFVVGLALTLRPAPETYGQLRGVAPQSAAQARAVEMAAFLRRELRPGDTVQPLDGITGGSMIALRQLDARLATRYIDDAPFYHHVSNPIIQAIRRDFIAQLEADPPRFVIAVPGASRPGGLDSADFPELDRFIAARYRVALAGEDFLIYEKSQGEPGVP